MTNTSFSKISDLILPPKGRTDDRNPDRHTGPQSARRFEAFLKSAAGRGPLAPLAKDVLTPRPHDPGRFDPRADRQAIDRPNIGRRPEPGSRTGQDRDRAGDDRAGVDRADRQKDDRRPADDRRSAKADGFPDRTGVDGDRADRADKDADRTEDGGEDSQGGVNREKTTASVTDEEAAATNGNGERADAGNEQSTAAAADAASAAALAAGSESAAVAVDTEAIEAGEHTDVTAGAEEGPDGAAAGMPSDGDPVPPGQSDLVAVATETARTVKSADDIIDEGRSETAEGGARTAATGEVDGLIRGDGGGDAPAQDGPAQEAAADGEATAADAEGDGAEGQAETGSQTQDGGNEPTADGDGAQTRTGVLSNQSSTGTNAATNAGVASAAGGPIAIGETSATPATAANNAASAAGQVVDGEDGELIWRQVRRAIGSIRTTAGGDQQMTIRLRPAELGSVMIRISTGDAGTTVALLAESAAAAGQLNQQRQQLITELEDGGLTGVAVDVGTTGDDAQAGDTDTDSDQPTPAGSGVHATAADTESIDRYRSRSGGANSAGLVDLDL